MAKRIKAFVNPILLARARENAGYGRDEVAARLKKTEDVVRGWEDGSASIFMGQLRTLADLYKRPLSDFYLPAPPDEQPIPHDFRRDPGQIANVYSPALRRQLRLARDRRKLSLALLDEMEDVPIQFDVKIAPDDDPEEVGETVRGLLGVTVEDQCQWGVGIPAFNQWRKRTEGIGVLVFQFENISPTEVWGFSLSDSPLPVIRINRKLRGNARTFTLLHEFAHVLLGEGSICDIEEIAERPRVEQRIERFCNSVAASTLMPKTAVLSHEIVSRHPRAEREWSDEEVVALSCTFNLSREAVVRRLHTLGLATWDFYLRKRTQYVAELAALAARERARLEADKAKGKQMMRNMPREALYNLSGPFIRLVLQTYSDQRMSLADASEYLGVRPNKVTKVEELAFGG